MVGAATGLDTRPLRGVGILEEKPAGPDKPELDFNAPTPEETVAPSP